MPQDRRDAAPEQSGRRGGGGEPGDGLSAAQVAGYLRRHPDFLREHPGLLDVLRPPPRGAMADSGDGVVDLQQAMVERLRGQTEALRHERQELVVTGRNNLAAQARIHKAVLDLLAAGSFEHLIETVTTDLAVALDVDVVTICVEQSDSSLPPARTGGVCRLPGGLVEALIGPRRNAVLDADVVGDPQIFGPAAGLVRSQALIRLDISSATPPALLAFGARDPQHFDSGQGTDLLIFLAQVLENIIRGWLDLPE